MSRPPPRPRPEDAIRIAPASAFSLEQLTAAYNHTRVDYLVPMPMNTARLAEYIRVYDVDMQRSVVGLDGDRILGLGMLGVRPGRTWITRLGVLPSTRRHGIGETLMRELLAAAHHLAIDFTVLEVIKHNTPAHQLFLKLGFYETCELLVLRRPPGAPALAPSGQARWLDRAEALARLRTRGQPIAWTNETESLSNVVNLQGFQATLPDGESGWLVFERQKFILSRICLQADRGDPARVGRELLAHLYQHYPDLDTHTENIPVDDAHLRAFLEAGFVESFRRIEMQRTREPA
jgi:ribosomal protein S18 acetylase RimI-like enzyme